MPVKSSGYMVENSVSLLISCILYAVCKKTFIFTLLERRDKRWLIYNYLSLLSTILVRSDSPYGYPSAKVLCYFIWYCLDRLTLLQGSLWILVLLFVPIPLNHGHYCDPNTLVVVLSFYVFTCDIVLYLLPNHIPTSNIWYVKKRVSLEYGYIDHRLRCQV